MEKICVLCMSCLSYRHTKQDLAKFYISILLLFYDGHTFPIISWNNTWTAKSVQDMHNNLYKITFCEDLVSLSHYGSDVDYFDLISVSHSCHLSW